MQWSSADTLLGEIPLAGGQTALTTIAAPGMGQATLAPMCLPYSPEYLPAEAREGARALDRLARATGGSERLDLASVWKDIPRRPRLMSAAPYLLLAAVVIFLLEVVERRMGLLSARWLSAMGRWFPRLLPRDLTQRVQSWTVAGQKAGASQAPIKSAAKPAVKAPVKPAEAVEPAADPRVRRCAAAAREPPAQKEAPAGGMLDALTHAQQRARKRTERR
jgi:hypothetical protein